MIEFDDGQIDATFYLFLLHTKMNYKSRTHGHENMTSMHLIRIIVDHSR